MQLVDLPHVYLIEIDLVLFVSAHCYGFCSHENKACISANSLCSR